MLLESLREFVVFSKYLNLTHAAKQLHMSQPNLGKHLKKLEAELGFALIDYSGKKLRLTPAGAVFLSDIQQELEQIDKTISTCKKYAESGTREILVQDPPYHDNASRLLLSILNYIKTTNYDTHVRFVHVNFKDHREMLRKGEIDIILEYRYAPDGNEELEQFYQNSDWDCFELGKIVFGLWFNKSVPVKTNPIEFKDLKNIPLCTFQDASNPYNHLFNDVYDSLRTIPNLRFINANSPHEFYHTVHPYSAILLPTSAMEEPLYSMRDDMSFAQFNPPFCPTLYAVMKRGSWCHDIFEEAYRAKTSLATTENPYEPPYDKPERKPLS